MMETSTDRELLYGEVTDALLADLRAGRQPDVAALARRYPHLADELEDHVAQLAAILRCSPTPTEVPPVSGPDEQLPRQLGDFRIVREVGRGGMGVVYEAEQISLGRRVALKVLPFAAALDPRQLQRFQNEAQAAAQLHHPHIVPVYAVGCERGVHYYAMQFIDGQTLAALIAGPAPPGDRDAVEPASRGVTADRGQPAGRRGHRSPGRHARATGPRPTSARWPGWGVQAAEALEHAHQLGVVHRDVKPANLLLDGARPPVGDRLRPGPASRRRRR